MSEHPVAGYVPTKSLSYVGIACFGVLALIFWFNFFKTAKGRYMITLCLTCTAMAIGFGVRIPLTDQPSSLGIYIGYTLLTLLSPCGFIATNYILLPRLATHISAEDCLFLPSRKIVRIFLWSDGITFFLQAAGGGMTAVQGNETMQKAGEYTALFGLIVQCISFAIFTVLLIVFGRRVRCRHPHKWSNTYTTPSGRNVQLRKMEDWRTVYYAVLYTCIGIMVRCIYRVVEYAQGYSGYLRTTEWCIYVLDSLPLFLAIIVWTVIWPPKVLQAVEHGGHQESTGMSPMLMGRADSGKSEV